MHHRKNSPRPLVLCLSGHDPIGGAGIHADIEACAANGAHALSVITANTVQDSSNVRRVTPVAPMLLAQQMEALLADCTIGAIKIGLLGDARQLPYLVKAIRQASVPLVLDPVLRAGGGGNLVSMQLQAAIVEQLFPLVSVLTPNAAEARRLAPGAPDLAGCAQRLMDAGCANILVTGGDDAGTSVFNTWYCRGKPPKQYEWPRINENFHGAGCTLAAAIAARLACGDELGAALKAAQAYTHRALQQAYAIGRGRKIPARLV